MEYTRDPETGDYICPFISCTFRSGKSNQSTMYYHMQKHINSIYPFKCKYCSFGCINQKQLDIHMQNRHKDIVKTIEEKHKYFLKCPFEDCTFQGTKGNCIIHINRIHFSSTCDEMLIGKSTCNVCEKEFKSKSAFYYHAFDCMEFDDKLQVILGDLL